MVTWLVVQAFRIRDLEMRVDTETLLAMGRKVDTTRIQSTRNPSAATTTASTELMEILSTKPTTT